MKSLLILFGLFIVNVYSLSYNWPTNPTHVAIIKPHITALFGPQSYRAITSIGKIAKPASFCDVPSDYEAMNRIILVERGNCTFYLKAQNAVRAGAAGIIIADINIEGGDFPLRMGYPPTENPSSIPIPVVSTSGSDFILIEKLIFSSNGSLWITLEQAGFDGHSTGGGGVHPTPNPNPNPPSGTGSHGNAGTAGEDNSDYHGGRNGSGRGRSFVMNGMIISAIVLSSCLCGFCMGRKCGNRGGRYCRRQQQLQQQANGVAPSPMDGSVGTVHGNPYVQVDMDQAAPVAYYGEQEMAPVPSAPPHPHDSSYPSSAPSNYA